ncbi:DNA helicase [Candidatus Methylobacter favarea]|uniref:DNA 3'-5' helicase n=1 Tax=Candidatus Methylobacter favarea TaxID=2707345 RepID=A0A8S0X7T8_9GAMM|nr:3'-5' exonuclease [Candidatus Methylobacter favarea]CAA9890367.1 DNA helicase [Candidatus Methylobacter favarea]
MHPKVAISSEFFSSVLKLPKAQQEKAVKFIELFRQDPTSPGINYESIQSARDRNLRSVRIDQAYRAIVLAPERGDVYILLWADKHDDAYEWAGNKVLRINPENGVLQILEAQYIDEAQQLQQLTGQKTKPGLFDAIKDRYLVRLGVPEELMPLVRHVEIPVDVDDLKAKLPDEAYEALAMLADGVSLEEALSVYDVSLQDEPAQIDTHDFAGALDNPDSKRRFLLASDDEALQTMLDAPLEKWRVFLHPLQRKLVFRDWNGPVRVLGGAGTGKTVVAMHRAKWLAERALTDRETRILFTTYTKNLAIDIEQNLKHICAPEALRKIEVINLDAWVKRFMDKQGYPTNFAFDKRQKKQLWDNALVLKPDALDLPDSFFHEEWEKVIQPQNVNSLENYFKARRLGRGVQLNRTLKKAVWPVFENYRSGLDDAGLKETEDAYRDALALIQTKSIQLPYTGIIVDEGQDFGLNAFRLIRQLAPEQQNDLFIVGDAHQRIYGSKVVLGQCGIKIIGRSRKLRINYRTTEQIRHWAVSLLNGIAFDDLDNGVDEQTGYRSLMSGTEPIIQCFANAQMEAEFIVNSLKELTDQGLAKACIAVRRHADMERYRLALTESGIPFYQIDQNALDNTAQPGVRLATVHRVKGLEFDAMYVAGINEGIVPLAILDSDDPTIIRERQQRERSLLYVAITRAKGFCSISGFGKLSQFISSKPA